MIPPQDDARIERSDVTISPPTAAAHAEGLRVRVVMRGYFSSFLLWTAQHQAELAGKIEATHVGDSRFSIEHQAYVLSSIVASVGFLEAMVNELYQDASDNHVPADGYIAPLSPDCRRLMAELWRLTNEGTRTGTFEKYEMLLAFGKAQRLDRGSQVYEDAKLALRLRNIVVHFRPEDLSAADEAHAMEKALRGKFEDNALMSGSGNPWWASHALGYGCADWAHRSVKALADTVSDALGITPNYWRNEESGWFGQAPGDRELDD